MLFCFFVANIDIIGYCLEKSCAKVELLLLFDTWRQFLNNPPSLIPIYFLLRSKFLKNVEDETKKDYIFDIINVILVLPTIILGSCLSILVPTTEQNKILIFMNILTVFIIEFNNSKFMERNMNFFRANQYSRINAVNYAMTYALHPNPSFRYFPLINNETSGDCTNFVSQCLLAGGAPMSFNGSHPWWYRKANTVSTKDDTWSIPWAVAHSLYWTLKINQQSKDSEIKGLEIYDTNLLELGDLVFFEDNNGHIFHSAIITSFRDSQPLVSHHSFEALNIFYGDSWGANRVHFLKISL